LLFEGKISPFLSSDHQIGVFGRPNPSQLDMESGLFCILISGARCVAGADDDDDDERLVGGEEEFA
jgi:hypothetical protein